ncbi:unnamed protein product, partial [Staurois parvus]
VPPLLASPFLTSILHLEAFLLFFISQPGCLGTLGCLEVSSGVPWQNV